MNGKTQGSPAVVTHKSGILFLTAAIAEPLKRGRRRMLALVPILIERGSCFLAGYPKPTDGLVHATVD